MRYGIIAGFLFLFPLLSQAAGNLADVQVYDRKQGVILATYIHDGRYYVAGEPGNEYEIRITNRGGERLLAVTSVDGVNVISGDTASPNQTGYVLSGYESTGIAGWRKSMSRIAAFYFTKLKNSYAARTGRPNDVGVIGVALFRERYQPPVYQEPPHCCWPFNSSRDEGDARPAAPAAKSAQESAGAMSDAQPQRREEKSRLGTGHGRSEHSVVTYTDFERASSTPDEVIAIYYDSRRNLVAQGVIPSYPQYGYHRPEPFPQGFVPDP
jgi:hypothetical protein